ncbi:hypothetical protein [Leucobacter sp. USHLN153]|uniref:hypothetical protein n=1 Tax=Leucobacter sp. USHLN153 TaxID=3081268 RepID=UPI0030195D07
MTESRGAAAGEPRPGEPQPDEGDETVVVAASETSDETVAVAASGDADETVVVPAAQPDPVHETVAVAAAEQAGRGDQHDAGAPKPSDDTVVVAAPDPVAPEETVVVPRAPGTGAPRSAQTAARVPSRSAVNPAPPVAEPRRAELPPELAARMFKSPLSTKYRVPTAPNEAPERALPRRGVTPALPVLSTSRAGRLNVGSRETDARIGPPPPAAALPPAADRSGLRSLERADRRFGIATVIGFGVSVVLAAGGLTAIAFVVFS